MSSTWNSGTLRIINTTRSPGPTPNERKPAATRATRSPYSPQVIDRQSSASFQRSAGAEANPKAQDLWLLAASIAKNTGRWEACARACEHVLERESLNGPALVMLAAAQRRTGDADAAEQTLRQLETVSPERARELREDWAGGGD